MDKENNIDWPMTIGLLLTIIGGIIAIGVAIVVSQSAVPLWALVFLGLSVEQVRRSPRDYHWKPITLGLIIGLMFVGVGAVIFYTEEIVALWAMILIGAIGKIME